MTLPSEPIGTSTRFGTDEPAVKLRLEASGRIVPLGYTVKNPVAVELVAVALSTTAVAPVAGTPPRPAICTLSEPVAGIFAAGAPRPSRVSRMRTGVSGR